jgi:hypothetical protein
MKLAAGRVCGLGVCLWRPPLNNYQWLMRRIFGQHVRKHYRLPEALLGRMHKRRISSERQVDTVAVHLPEILDRQMGQWVYET